VRDALDRTWEFFERYVTRRAPADAFQLFRAALVFMIDLRTREPDLAAIYARVVFVADTHLREQLLPSYQVHSDEFYERLVPWGVREGLIDPAMPPAVARFMFNAVGARFQSLVLVGDRPGWLPRSSRRGLERFADQLVESMRRALAPRSAD
jgi:hypothetical protein